MQQGRNILWFVFVQAVLMSFWALPGNFRFDCCAHGCLCCGSRNSQKELARKLHTSEQNISRLESPSYEGHSLAMLRRVAEFLGATLRVILAEKGATEPMTLSEAKVACKTRRK